MFAPKASPAVLSTDRLAQSFGGIQILDGISLSVGSGEFLSIVGPSGCGKTTLLILLAGLMQPTAGSVVFEGRIVANPPDGIATVFQDYSRSLFPWRRNLDNVILGMHRARSLARDERRSRASRLLEQVGLKGAERSYPWQLSGGMQQRVAIARALASDPRLLLLDEPLAAVDAQTRSDIQDLILVLAAEREQTSILVTHDVEEAIYMSHRVIVLTHRPTRVREVIDVDLPWPRNQLGTREAQRFLAIRHHVLSLVHSSRTASDRTSE